MSLKVCTLLFLLKDDEILLAMKKRGFGEGRWNGVGGKIEPGETEEQALVRECQEEIGVTPLEYEKVATHDFKFPDGTTDMQVHAYLSRKWRGTPVETEEMAPQWFKTADIPYDDMWQDDIVWLPLVLRGKKLHTTFTFDEADDMQAAELHLL
ncbi:MAG TPA: 8-oxo-dGTP diphosphatase [Candidatus Saccharimonadales bacterium]|nr:8-oxo-dGTP diphosphatase [Candidatus Saccharimonadales bacterium]